MAEPRVTEVSLTLVLVIAISESKSDSCCIKVYRSLPFGRSWRFYNLGLGFPIQGTCLTNVYSIVKEHREIYLYEKVPSIGRHRKSRFVRVFLKKFFIFFISVKIAKKKHRKFAVLKDSFFDKIPFTSYV
jgi:hypothetical protein